MKKDFRTRAFLPVVMPLAILVVVATLVTGFSLILLYNTHEAALVIAAVTAAGILVSIALAVSQQEPLRGSRRVAVLAAGLLPVVAGGGFASFSASGGVDPALLNINRQPHLTVPDDAVIGATSADAFCLPTGDGGCEDTREWSVTAQGPELFVFEFENRDEGVQHNVDLFSFADENLTPEQLASHSGDELLFHGEIFPGIAERIYQAESGLDPGRYLFQCEVHQSTMLGILTVTQDADHGDQ